MEEKFSEDKEKVYSSVFKRWQSINQTLLDGIEHRSAAFLDDLSVRTEAQNDPAFFLDKLSVPCLIDEMQYAPNLFASRQFLINCLQDPDQCSVCFSARV